MLQPFSYRDVDGFLVFDKNSVTRYVQLSYAKHYDHLMGSGLYQRLVDEGLLLSHTENEKSERDEDNLYYRVLKPIFLPFINYPYEWTASQWKEVLLSYLRINLISLEYGMLLKDATPFNFTFHEGKCIFFDTLSFEIYNNGDSWIAYRQFCELMLGPASLIFFNDVTWIGMLQSNINGWSLPFISKNLNFKTWLNITLFIHIHLHAKYRKKVGKINSASGLTKDKLSILFSMLEKSIGKWRYKKSDQQWVDYYNTNIFSDDYVNEKKEKVIEWITSYKPKSLIDLGANIGIFSMLAVAHVQNIISIDNNHDSLEQLRISLKQKNVSKIDTVLADISQPTSGLGWQNREHTPLLERLSAEMVLSLAFLHHLCISKNIPLPFVAEMYAQMTNKYVIVEFVPKTDPNVIQMIQYRKDVFDLYNEEHFIKCFSVFFRLKDYSYSKFSTRKLYLWEKK